MNPKATKVILRRGVAFLVDTIPGFAIYWLLVVSLGEKLGEEPGTNWVMKTEWVNGDITAQLGDSVYYLPGGDFAIVAVVSLAYWIGLFVVVQGLTGATIGKTLLAIRTVDVAGRPCGLGRAAVRWLLIVVDAFFYLFPIVGLVTAAASEGNRRVGDMAAQTYVVRKSAVGHPVRVGAGVAAPAAAPVAGPPAAGPPVEVGAPQWDPRLGAYVSWDAQRQIWLRWNDATGRWDPLEFDPRGSSLDD